MAEVLAETSSLEVDGGVEKYSRHARKGDGEVGHGVHQQREPKARGLQYLHHRQLVVLWKYCVEPHLSIGLSDLKNKMEHEK